MVSMELVISRSPPDILRTTLAHRETEAEALRAAHVWRPQAGAALIATMDVIQWLYEWALIVSEFARATSYSAVA